MIPLLVVSTTGDTIALYAPRTRALIGRSAQCDLEVNDPNASRRHAEVGCDGDLLWVRDLGSGNGTFVNGQRIGQEPVLLEPGVTLTVGQTPLTLRFGGASEARAPQRSAAPQQPAPSMQTLIGAAPAGLGGHTAPVAGDFPFRSQGANGNGTLLIALRRDHFTNAEVLDGFLEYTSTDAETIDHIYVELVEYHDEGPRKGHVWDRMLVRQGPWNSNPGDRVPMPFSLRIPPGTSPSGRRVHWELRSTVDISWGSDVEAKASITMRNTDIDRLRDALGHLDYRLVELEPDPLGQRFTGRFQPPAHATGKVGITDVNLRVQYLGANLEVELEVEKSSWFRADKAAKAVFDLARLRVSRVEEVAAIFESTIAQLMQK